MQVAKCGASKRLRNEWELEIIRGAIAIQTIAKSPCPHARKGKRRDVDGSLRARSSAQSRSFSASKRCPVSLPLGRSPTNARKKFENERSTNSESDFSDNSSHCGGECDRTEVIFPRKAFPRKPIETSPPSFDHRSVGFQSASEDPVQTCNSPPAFSREAEFSLLEFSSS